MMVESYLMQSRKAPSIIEKLLSHRNRTDISIAKILEIYKTFAMDCLMFAKLISFRPLGLAFVVVGCRLASRKACSSELCTRIFHEVIAHKSADW